MPIQRSAIQTLLTLLIFAVLGAAASGRLLIDHDGGWDTPQDRAPYLSRFCESEAIPSASCADVIASRWGSFDATIGTRRVLVPTSLLGFAYFVAAAIWFAMVGCPPRDAHLLWYITLLSVSCGLAASLFFVALMAGTRLEWCPLCVVAHIANFGVFVCAIRLRRAATAETAPSPSQAKFAGWMDPHRRMAALAFAVAVAAAVSSWAYFDAVSVARTQWRKLSGLRTVIDSMQKDPAFVVREYRAQPVVSIPERVELEQVGQNPNAAAQLVIFTDYDSSASACFERQRRTLIDHAFAGKLLVEHRYTPGINSNQSSHSRKTLLESSDRWSASCAAEAARLQGGTQAFDKMHRLLFSRSRDGSERDYRKLAKRAGLNVARFLVDMNSETVRRSVGADVALAGELGVTSTPAAFLNGRRVPDLCLKSTVFWQEMATRLNTRGKLAKATTERVTE